MTTIHRHPEPGIVLALTLRRQSSQPDSETIPA